MDPALQEQLRRERAELFNPIRRTAPVVQQPIAAPITPKQTVRLRAGSTLAIVDAVAGDRPAKSIVYESVRVPPGEMLALPAASDPAGRLEPAIVTLRSGERVDGTVSAVEKKWIVVARPDRSELVIQRREIASIQYDASHGPMQFAKPTRYACNGLAATISGAISLDKKLLLRTMCIVNDAQLVGKADIVFTERAADRVRAPPPRHLRRAVQEEEMAMPAMAYAEAPPPPVAPASDSAEYSVALNHVFEPNTVACVGLAPITIDPTVRWIVRPHVEPMMRISWPLDNADEFPFSQRITIDSMPNTEAVLDPWRSETEMLVDCPNNGDVSAGYYDHDEVASTTVRYVRRRIEIWNRSKAPIVVDAHVVIPPNEIIHTPNGAELTVHSAKPQHIHGRVATFPMLHTTLGRAHTSAAELKLEPDALVEAHQLHDPERGVIARTIVIPVQIAASTAVAILYETARP